jgi:glycosyltransferase involved in cell wall biosynthesis
VHNIQAHFRSGQWFSAAKIERPFVKFAHLKVSPGKVWHYEPENSDVILSVLIPTMDANRKGYFKKLLIQISKQSYKKFEIIVVCNDPRQGRAINIAAALARGNYLLTLDDDTSLPERNTFEKLINVMEKNSDIGIAGGNNTIPLNSPTFVKQAMKQIPRRSWKVVSKITVSDLAEHPCMIMRADEFKKVGGENELIYRGLDPYLREEFRKINKLVVVVPHVIYHHLPPDSPNKLIRQFFRNGLQACLTNRNYPQWVIETPNHHGPFQKRRNTFHRRCRFFITLVEALIKIKPIWFACEMAYAAGYIWGMKKNNS